MKVEINSKTTLKQLKAYEPAIENLATSLWRDLLTSLIKNISENELVMRERDSHPYWEYISKDEALKRVQSSSWQTLHKLTFENAGSYAVPILGTFQRAPTLLPGSIVDIAVYDYPFENLYLLCGNSTVLSVIYPKDELGTISWTLTDDGTTHSYSTDVWEAIKAATAGDPEAAEIEWEDYSEYIMKRAQKAGIGDYELEALYIVEVASQDDARLITQYEQYMKATKDIILLAHTRLLTI